MNSSFLSSSIFGKEFINYRKHNSNYVRTSFSSRVRNQGNGYVPIIVDAVDQKLSALLSGCDIKHTTQRRWTYGLELSLHLESTVEDLLTQIETTLSNIGYVLDKDVIYKLGLENGNFVEKNDKIGTLYKNHRNEKDKILYFLLTTESTKYGYLLSIFKYLFPWFFKK